MVKIQWEKSFTVCVFTTNIVGHITVFKTCFSLLNSMYYDINFLDSIMKLTCSIQVARYVHQSWDSKFLSLWGCPFCEWSR